MGLEPTKIDFAGRRLDHFGIAISGKQHGRQRLHQGLVNPDFSVVRVRLYPKLYPKCLPKSLRSSLFTPHLPL